MTSLYFWRQMKWCTSFLYQVTMGFWRLCITWYVPQPRPMSTFSRCVSPRGLCRSLLTWSVTRF